VPFVRLAFPWCSWSFSFSTSYIIAFCLGFVFYCCSVTLRKLLWKCKRQFFCLNG